MQRSHALAFLLAQHAQVGEAERDGRERRDRDRRHDGIPQIGLARDGHLAPFGRRLLPRTEQAADGAQWVGRASAEHLGHRLGHRLLHTVRLQILLAR